MSRRPSRRQWLLGLVGAVFGASAARAAERWLPAEKAAGPATLTLTERQEKGGERTYSRPAAGKVVVEYDPRDGTLRVTEHDAGGKPVAHPDGSVRAVTLSLPPVARCDVTITREAPGVVTTYTYDSEGRVTSVCDGVQYSTYLGGKGKPGDAC